MWRYIQREKISVVPLYFAQLRPVVRRDGALIMVDDARLPLNKGERPVMRKVRFRTDQSCGVVRRRESLLTEKLSIHRSLARSVSVQDLMRVMGISHPGQRFLERPQQDQ